jgi:phosphotransferase system  glucose/maltose/N-acetylglucosamine-specific IIC component
MVLAEEKPSIAEILDANRRFIYALLATPYLGMTIAIGLIWYRKPSNMHIAIIVIFFLMVQYGLTVYFFIKKMDSMAGKRKNHALRDSKDDLGEEEERR